MVVSATSFYNLKTWCAKLHRVAELNFTTISPTVSIIGNYACITFREGLVQESFMVLLGPLRITDELTWSCHWHAAIIIISSC